MRVGNYLPHANCVNAAIESYALPGARYPDLIGLQAQVRAALSAKIDSRRITVQAGQRRGPTSSPRRSVTAMPAMTAQHPGGSRRSNRC